MEINADFSKRVLVHGAELPWQASPIAGVQRRMLERIGDEKARATSIVRYAPHSRFSTHTHDGGEEFLVLEGVFQDEHGDFPVGSYVRNPPTSSHTPGSELGCVILVKLWQFDPGDRTHLRIDTHKMSVVYPVERPGVTVKPLFEDDYEDVRLESWQANINIQISVPGGLELFVLAGSLTEGEDSLQRHSWLRLPKQSQLQAKTGPQGTTVWIKSGHLVRQEQTPFIKQLEI